MSSNLRKTLRPVLNTLRRVNKIPFLESFLSGKTQGKDHSSFWVKLLPPLHSYKRGSIRHVQRNGINYRLDISDFIEYVIYFGLAIEPKKSLYNSVKDGMNIFDIGTNMGETLLNFAKLNPGGKNYGFEPVPFLHEKAMTNINLNNFGNIYLNNLALSHEAGVLFFELPKNRNFGSISMSVSPNENSKEVKAVTFDSYITDNNISKVDLVKIDVEGFEKNVLLGAVETIKRFKPVLFIEVVDSYLKKNGSSATDLIHTIISLGYTVSDADTLESLDQVKDFSGKVHDILCRPLQAAS
jgi:FkbM family methyltransferase